VVKTTIKSTISEYNKALLALLSNAHASGLWRMVGEEMGGIVDEMYERWGGKYGRPTWPGVSPSLWGRPRIGTDGKRHGVYTPRSIPLEASAEYKASFGVLSSSPREMTYGTAFALRAGKKRLLANLMPYAGWRDKPRGDGLKYMPRYVLPDPHSAEFARRLEAAHRRYLDFAIREAARRAAPRAAL